MYESTATLMKLASRSCSHKMSLRISSCMTGTLYIASSFNDRIAVVCGVMAASIFWGGDVKCIRLDVGEGLRDSISPNGLNYVVSASMPMPRNEAKKHASLWDRDTHQETAMRGWRFAKYRGADAARFAPERILPRPDCACQSDSAAARVIGTIY
jgi:hypothetical protein